MGAFIKHSWIMLLFIPIAVCSLVYGIVVKKQNKRYKKNIIISCIVIPFLLIFGMYFSIFSDEIDYTNEPILSVEERTGIDFPDNIESMTEKMTECTVIYAKIPEDNQSFITEIQKSGKWVNKLNSKIINAMPIVWQSEISNRDYYVFYNETTNEFNVYPQTEGDYSIILIAFDIETGRLIILDNYTLSDG